MLCTDDAEVDSTGCNPRLSSRSRLRHTQPDTHSVSSDGLARHQYSCESNSSWRRFQSKQATKLTSPSPCHQQAKHVDHWLHRLQACSYGRVATNSWDGPPLTMPHRIKRSRCVHACGHTVALPSQPSIRQVEQTTAAAQSRQIRLLPLSYWRSSRRRLEESWREYAKGPQRVAASRDRKVTFCPLPSAVLAPVFLQVRQGGLRLKDSKDRPTKAAGSATGPMATNGLNCLKQAGDRAGVGVKVGTSILRPSFSIREQLLGRLPDHGIAEQMGHFSGSTSLLRRVYVPTHLPSAPTSEEALGNLRRQAAARAGAAPSRPVAAELTYSQLDRLQVHLRKYLDDSTEENSAAIVQEWELIAGFRLNARNSATQAALLLNEADETTWDVSRQHPFVSGGHFATIKDALVFVRAGESEEFVQAAMVRVIQHQGQTRGKRC